MRRILFVALLFALAGLNAQDYQSLIYKHYLDGHMDLWEGVMEQMEQEYRRSKNTRLLLDLTEAQYGYIGYCLGDKQKKRAKSELAKAMDHIEILKKNMEPNPRVYSLEGAFYGFMIRFEPLRVRKYGALSEEANKRALELDSREAQAWMEKANIAFYKPAFAGGDKEEAVTLYEKAVSLFEAFPEGLTNNWLYLNCQVGLAMAYEETDRLQAARKLYEKMLRREPTFQWVSKDLYPRLLEKQGAN
jgi:tetratricopeptide (TPR) repeat protein